MPGEGHFQRRIGLFDLTTLIMGSMIGSGIFFLPGSMLAILGTTDAAGTIHIGGGAWPVLLAWIVGAVIALCGGLTFADLGAAFPRAGGQYAFVRDSLGRLPAFLFSWTAVSVVQSGTIAAVAVAFAESVDRLWSLPGTEIRLLGGALVIPKWGVAYVAVAVVALLTWVNYRGVRRGALVSNLSTVAKVAALVFIAGIAILFGHGANSFSHAHPFTGFGVASFGVAASASLFAYDGFAQATFVAAEVKEARRVLPRAIVLATVLVAAIYLGAVFAYFHVLAPAGIGQATLSGHHPIASDAAEAIFVGGGALVAAAIVVSTFGTVNAYILSSPRIYHQVATDGEFPRPFGHLSPHGTPTYGLVYGALWACLLTLTGSYFALANLVVFGLYAFYLITMIGYFVLRRREPEAFRGFRIPLAPLWGGIFMVAAVGVLASYVAQDLGSLFSTGSVAGFAFSTTGLGVLLIALGVAVFYLFFRSRPASQGP
ncbi:MAG: APC family permease [Thermoplasmatota archaeon]